MALTEKARELLAWLGDEYVKAGFPNHNVWNFSPVDENQMLIFLELRAHGFIKTMGAGRHRWVLTDVGQRTVIGASQSVPTGAVGHRHQGDIVLGHKYETVVAHATAGAVAIGCGAVATGHAPPSSEATLVEGERAPKPPTGESDTMVGAPLIELAQTIGNALASIRAAVKAASPQLAGFVSMIFRTKATIDHWDNHAAPAQKDAIAGAGLIVPVSYISLPELVNLLEVAQDESTDAAVRLMRRHYDEIFSTPGFLDGVERSWEEDRRLERRFPLLQQALEAHELGLYGTSVPTLLAQFEGLVVDIVEHTGRLNGALAQKYVDALAGGQILIGPLFSSFVGDAFYAQFAHGGDVPAFSRNAILHGGDVNYATETHSRTAILLIENLRVLAGRRV